MKREECVKLLRENDVFKSLLQQTKDEKERRYVKAYAEDFVTKFYDNVFAPIEKAFQEDPESVRKAVLEVLQDRASSNDTKNDGEESEK